MLRSFIKNSSIYFFSGILTKSISFLLLPLYTSILTQNDYGSLEAISVISTIVIMIFSFQINEGVSRYYNELNDQKEIQLYTSTVAIFCIATFSTFLSISLIFNNHLAVFYGVNSQTTVLASLSIFLNALFYFSQNQLTWKLKPAQEAISALFYNLSAIGLSIILLVHYNLGIEGIMIAQCIASVLGICSGLYFTHQDFRFTFSQKVLSKLLHFSIPLIPRALSVFLFLFTDRFCVKQLLGLKALGIFSVGNKIASILIIVNLGIATALSPLIYKYYKEKDTPIKIGILFRVFCFGSFIFISGLSFFAEIIIRIFTNENYISAAICVPFLASSIFFSSILQFFPGLILSKKTLLLSGITTLTGILNLVFNILLIPYFGVLGSAIVTCICFGINFYFLYLNSQKEYWVDVSLKGLFFMFFIFLLLIICTYIFQLSLFWNIAFFLFTITLGYLLLIRKSDMKILKTNIFSKLH